MKQNRKIVREPIDHEEAELQPIAPPERTLPQGDGGPKLALPPAEKDKRDAHGKGDDNRTLLTRKGKFWLIGIAVVLLLAALLGFLPRHFRNKRIEKEAERKKDTPPTVEVVE